MIEEPFEYLTFGRTFGRAFGIFFDRFDIFMAISCVSMIPFALLFLSVVVAMLTLVFANYDPDVLGHSPVGILIFGFEILIYALATIVGQGAIIIAVAKLYIGEHQGWLQCLKLAWKRKWPLLGFGLILFGCIFLATIIVVVFYFIMAIYPNGFTTFMAVAASLAYAVASAYAYSGLLLGSPAIVVEGYSNPISGMKRSWELSSGSRCYLICAIVSLLFLFNMLYAFFNNLFGSGDFFISIFNPLDIVIRIIPTFLYFPIHSIIVTVLYLNLRIGRESMNHQVLSGDLLNDASPASRFRNDDPTAEFSQDSMDYRHVPLVDGGEGDAKAIPITTAV